MSIYSRVRVFLHSPLIYLILNARSKPGWQIKTCRSTITECLLNCWQIQVWQPTVRWDLFSWPARCHILIICRYTLRKLRQKISISIFILSKRLCNLNLQILKLFWGDKSPSAVLLFQGSSYIWILMKFFQNKHILWISTFSGIHLQFILSRLTSSL